MIFILFMIFLLSCESFFPKIKHKSYRYTILHNKQKSIYKYHNISNYFDNHPQLQDKKILSIYPAGLKGFYQMGITTYMKKNMDLDSFIFNGASAGAWNSLLLSYKGNIDIFKEMILSIDYESSASIFEMQKRFKKKIIEKFSSDDFELDKIYISVTVLDNFQFKTFTYTDFENLEDALDCIIASSNIPFITGKLIYIYRNKLCFDGGFKPNPFIYNQNPNISIYPFPNNKNNILIDNSERLENYNEFQINNKIIHDLFYKGFYEAKKMKQVILNKLQIS